MFILDCVGNTPLVKVHDNIFIKLEYMNPFGSFKDRVAMWMLKDKPPEATTIIESGTGNTAVSLAFMAQQMGLKCHIVIPEYVSNKKVQLLELAGAEVVFKKKVKECLAYVNEIKSRPGFWHTGQFKNVRNIEAHYNTTAPEIWKQTEGKIDAFVCGVGSSGMIVGVGRFLKQKNPHIKIIAVEPDLDHNLSSLLRGVHIFNTARSHKIEGIGTGFIPEIYDHKVVDDIITCTDDQAKEYQLKYIKKGILGGISTGANLFVAEQVKGECVVTIAADSTERYL